MTHQKVSLELIGAMLSALVVSCSPARHTTFAADEDLHQQVLVIRQSPEGVVTHSWHRAKEFDIEQYRLSSSSHPAYGRIVLAAHQRDCDAENLECVRKCMSRPLAPGLGHITSSGRKKGGKLEYCEEQCDQPYQDCMNLQDLRPQEFSAVDQAMAWVKGNHKLILIGSIVIIAGIVFVAVAVGVGLIVLVPAVLLAS